MVRKLALGLVLVGATLSAAVAHHEATRLRAMLPESGFAPRGLLIEGVPIPEGRPVRELVLERADALLDRRIALMDGDRTLATVTLRDLGATADVEWTTRRALDIAQRGTFRRRVEAALDAAAGRYDVALPLQLPVEPLAEKLSAMKEERDTLPRSARRRLDASAGTVSLEPHADGQSLDAHATVERLLRAARAGEARVDVARYSWVPRATSEAVRDADVGQELATFETRFGGPVGRDRNIARAASLLDGVVLMPGEIVSFNAIVGPRSSDNGFFSAPEIYKGEMRQGIGGGACQVASTLHAAAFFGGLEIVERQNHSRPSGYIRMGLDSTVSFPVLDLRLKNPFEFPIVVRTRAEGGRMRFDLLGKERRVRVLYASETSGVLEFNRKLERAALPEGEFKLKQKGKRGLRLRRLRTLEALDGTTSSVEESTDVYPPTQEIWLVAPGVDESALPPLEGDAPQGA